MRGTKMAVHQAGTWPTAGPAARVLYYLHTAQLRAVHRVRASERRVSREGS